MKNENEKKTRNWRMKMKERKFYLYTAVGCAAALLSLVIVAVAATARGEKPSAGVNQPGVEDNSGEVNGGVDEKPDDKPVVNQPEEMILPMENVAVSGDYGFWYNKTLNVYHAHCGLDFAAEAGSEVSVVMSGVVESIYRDDVLSGTEITVDHGDGLKSVYRFVDAVENLKVGDEVAQGDVIATVAAATGDEYKDGAHLHFEVMKNGANVDPTSYLTLEEK